MVARRFLYCSRKCRRVLCVETRLDRARCAVELKRSNAHRLEPEAKPLLFCLGIREGSRSVCRDCLNRKGNELDSKKDDYAQIGVAYYVVFDPLRQLQKEGESNGNLLKIWVLTAGQYVEMSEPFWLQTVGLEGQESTWLRWCDDREGRVIPTGAERADEAELKAQRLAERLRAMGVDPDEI